MATGEAPITRTDLREELTRALEHYATKADLAVLKAELVRAMADLEVRLSQNITSGEVVCRGPNRLAGRGLGCAPLPLSRALSN